MKMIKYLVIFACVSLFFLSASLKADEWNKETKITFSGPVRVQDTDLPAGTYVFKLADTADRHIVQIFNEDQSQIIATILATPDYRLTPTGRTAVRFSETNDGGDVSGTMPENGMPVKEWFYPGDNTGQEFRVVPLPPVAAVEPPPAVAPPASETPNVSAEPEAAAPPAEEEATPPEAPAAPPQTGQTNPDNQQSTAPAQLPQTASELPLLGLIGLVSLVAAAAFRRMSKSSH